MKKVIFKTLIFSVFVFWWQGILFCSEDLYEIVVQENILIPMRDGIKLATDIYCPAKNGIPVEDKLPILLTRTPYGKSTTNSQFRFVSQAKYFVEHGYVVVIQDCRGRFASEGVFTKYVNEAQDGFDTIEWLAKLPFTNGKVGMWGTSYGAHVQAAAAQLNPPHLETIVLNMGGTYNGWDHAIRNHGAFEMKQLTWAFEHIKDEAKSNPVILDMLNQERIEDWVMAFPFRKGLSPLSLAPNFEDYILEMMTHVNYDDYWKQLGLNWSVHYPQTSDIPMLHISGWYDSYCGTAIGNYEGLVKLKKGPIRLLMGPWLHGKNDSTHSGNVDFGPDAAIKDFYTNYHLRWFDYFLKGIDNGLGNEPAIRLFVMGTGDGRKNAKNRLYHGGYWKTAESWPLPDTKFIKYYFHYDGTLMTSLPTTDDPIITYSYDPKHPVPTIGGSTVDAKPLYVGGPFNQREKQYKGNPATGFYGSKPPYLPLKARADVVVFQTEPLKEDIEIIGPITVKLYASSDAVDTDFTAKLIDVYPPSKDFPSGFEMNLTDGIIRARYRNSREKQELLKPGKIYEFVIKPFPTSNVFKKGHRIRVDISSSNFPRFDVNPNTGEPIGLSRRVVVTNNSIYVDKEHPSHVILPIIPYKP
ncbi:MAG: CocE/NonD family hydrolase [bacterium]|nr:MAG: CocE/NonD family hydrolase [bacterium]